MKEQKIILNKIVVIFASAFAFAMVAFPEVTEEGSKSAIIIWANSIVPVLLPFFIFADFIRRTGELTRLSPGIYAFAMAFLSGYPIGAKVVCDCIRDGRASREEGRYILSYSLVTGPAFILFTVGEFIGSRDGAMIVAAAHYAGAFINGLIYANHSGTTRRTEAKSKPELCGSYTENFTYAITGGFRAMAVILAYLIFFTIGISLMEKAELFAHINNETVSSCIKGLLEMTVGINRVGLCDIGVEFKVVLSSMLVSFGGLSVIGQASSMARDSGINFAEILLIKLTHGMIAAILAIITVNFVVL